MNGFMQSLTKIDQRHNLAADYEKTLALLAALKVGQVSLDQVMLIEGGWRVLDIKTEAPAEQPAEMPAAIVERNGTPADGEPVKD